MGSFHSWQIADFVLMTFLFFFAAIYDGFMLTKKTNQTSMITNIPPPQKKTFPHHTLHK